MPGRQCLRLRVQECHRGTEQVAELRGRFAVDLQVRLCGEMNCWPCQLGGGVPVAMFLDDVLSVLLARVRPSL